MLEPDEPIGFIGVDLDSVPACVDCLIDLGDLSVVDAVIGGLDYGLFQHLGCDRPFVIREVSDSSDVYQFELTDVQADVAGCCG